MQKSALPSFMSSSSFSTFSSYFCSSFLSSRTFIFHILFSYSLSSCLISLLVGIYLFLQSITVIPISLRLFPLIRCEIVQWICYFGCFCVFHTTAIFSFLFLYSVFSFTPFLLLFVTHFIPCGQLETSAFFCWF